MIIVEKPVLNFIPINDRNNGISLILRVKNGEDYLRHCIKAAIDQVDEIIAVFNDSVDETEDILVGLEEKYPEKIKVFKYIPKVYPPNSDYYKINKINSNDLHSLSHYYNFALSKTTFSHVCKFDDDNLMFPNSFRKLKKQVELLENNVAIGLKGLNLFDLSECLYVNKANKFTSGLDTLMFKYNNQCRFVQTVHYELFKSNYKTDHIELCFYHLKSCKKDRGMNNYNLNTNTKSRYIQMYTKVFNNINLVLLEEFNKKLPNPYDLGFEYINESTKQYDCQLFTDFESKIAEKYAKILS
jgi:glycosyltransferase involved in cell wall biosynthesis